MPVAEPNYPPKSAKVALVLVAILWIGTMVGLGIYLPKAGSQPTTQPSTQAPANAQ